MQRHRNADERRQSRREQRQDGGSRACAHEARGCDHARERRGPIRERVDGDREDGQREEQREERDAGQGEGGIDGCARCHDRMNSLQVHLLPVAAAQALSMSAFFAAALFTSSGRTCGAGGSLSATFSGSFTPGTDGRTKPCAKMPCPVSVMMKLSQSRPALGFGAFSTRLIAYGAAAEASFGMTTATASPRPSVYFALSPSFS